MECEGGDDQAVNHRMSGQKLKTCTETSLGKVIFTLPVTGTVGTLRCTSNGQQHQIKSSTKDFYLMKCWY